MRRSAPWFGTRAAIATAVSCLLLASGAFARSETVLHGFTGGLDGGSPNGPLIVDASGNLYGTATTGGRYGYGVVFRFEPPATPSNPWTERVLYNFLGGLDGNIPSAALVMDASGNLYGTTPGGGRFNGGEVYRLSPPHQKGGVWRQSVLYSFDRRRGDGSPASALALDGAGYLYGSCDNGGAGGRGFIYRLTPNADGKPWNRDVLYTFAPCSVCGVPSNGMTLRGEILYGFTTFQVVGNPDVAFSLAPPPKRGGAWTFSDLHDFGGPGDGDIPVSVPLFDAAGNLYGTTESGGIGQCQGGGCGTVFELSPPTQHGGAWTETLLYTFTGGADGGASLSSLVADVAGNLYGTTVDGGARARGTAFELMRASGGAWSERVVHSFAGGLDGEYPQSGMTFGKDGALYGTTAFGGLAPRRQGFGSLYRIGE